jgi:hypothetical protein
VISESKSQRQEKSRGVHTFKLPKLNSIKEGHDDVGADASPLTAFNNNSTSDTTRFAA